MKILKRGLIAGILLTTIVFTPADRNSPWSPMAPYLVARCLIRKAAVPQKYGTFNKNALQEAARELRGIIQDKTRASLHPISCRHYENACGQFRSGFCYECRRKNSEEFSRISDRPIPPHPTPDGIQKTK